MFCVLILMTSTGAVVSNSSTLCPGSDNYGTNILKTVLNSTYPVRFTLNNEHQIVVLSVETENLVLADFVKKKLNYKEVDLERYKEGKIYTIPVRIVG